MLPDGIPTVTVTGRYLTPEGTPLSGRVVFRAPALITLPDHDVILGGPVTEDLDANGAFSVTLPATDTPDMNPSGWTYSVAEQLVGVAQNRVYQILLPSDVPVVDLADLAPTDPTTPTYIPVVGPPGPPGPAGPAGPKGDPASPYDVRAYGAVGDGVTNDTAAIQAALDAAATAGGGVVLLPAGTYNVHTYLAVSRGTTVRAHGATVRAMGGVGLLRNYRPAESFTAYNGHGRVTVEGGIWDANARSADGASGVTTGIVNAFSFGHAEHITVRDLTIRDVSSAHAIEVNACSDVAVTGCRFEGFRDSGGTRPWSEAVQLDYAVPDSGSVGAADGTWCRNVLVSGCWFGPSARLPAFGRAVGSHTSVDAATWHTGVQVLGNRIAGTAQEGIRAYGWRNAIIADNVISGTGAACIIVTGPDPAVAGYNLACQAIAIRGNTVGDAPGSSPLRVVGFATARPSGVVISGNTVTGAAATGVYVSQAVTPRITDNLVSAAGSLSVSLLSCTAPHVAANTCLSGGSTGISLDTCTGGHVGGNVVDTTAAGHGVLISGGSDVSVNGNRVIGAKGSGIRVTTSAARIRVTGNHILRGGQTAIGLDVTASATDCLIVGNDLTGSGWAAAATALNLAGTRQTLDWSGGTTAPGFNLAS